MRFGVPFVIVEQILQGSGDELDPAAAELPETDPQEIPEDEGDSGKP